MDHLETDKPEKGQRKSTVDYGEGTEGMCLTPSLV